MNGSGFQFSTTRVINVEESRKDTPINRRALLSWVNETLQTDFTRVDELCTGAAYCQLWDIIMPGTLNITDIKFVTNTEADFLYNFSVLQMAFRKNGVAKEVPVERLVKGYYMDNLEFLNWFKNFYDVNNKGGVYHGVSIRKGVSSFVQETLRPYSLFAQDFDDIPSCVFSLHH